ncbi:MAG: RimK/LysX family protein, partial [Hyphomicrobiaceae bacterium]
MSTSSQLGWEEWLALPELGLPAIKAKVDTGARTSALHAFQIEPFGPPDAPMVRFGIHPVPGREEIEVYCSARVIDRRQVRSSNGRRESRYVISTTVKMGRRSWPIEVTLTNRENMAYRMLLGRKAIPEDMIVDPGTSFLQPRLSYRLYSDVPRSITVRRSLRIALLTTRPNTTTSVRLRAAGEEAGHVVEVLDPMRLSLVVDADRPALLLDGNLLPHFDAVVARLGQRPSAFGTAIVRQLEMLGSFLVNPAQALGIARDRLQQHQLLAASGVRNPALAVTQTRKSTRRIADLVGGPPVVVRRGSGSATDAGVLARTRRSMDMALSTLGGREDEYLIERSVDDVSGERVHNVVIGTKVAASLADRTSSLSEGSRPRV